MAMRLNLAEMPEPVLDAFVKNDSLKEGHAREIVQMSIFDNLTYARLGHERVDDVIGLCRQCHMEIHGLD
jgi:hypothetical protein